MDKIASENWVNVFREQQQQVLYRSDRYGETLYQFSEPGLAKGYFSLIETPGMLVRQINLITAGKLLLTDNNGAEGIESVYSLDGGVESMFLQQNKSVNFSGSHHGFQYSPSSQGQHIIHKGKLDVLQVSFDLSFFKSLANSSSSGALDAVCNSMECKKPYMVAPSLLVLQPRMAEIVHAVRQCRFRDVTKYLFIEAKMMELLALQIDEIEQIKPVGSSKENMAAADKEKLKAVKEFIELHYLEPLTLAGLTSQFGLNEFKLKKGFRQLFHTSVFGYILHLRMKKAQQLLKEQQMNVSETAFFVGYNNVSSFSAEFKKRFGYLPSAHK